MKQCPQCGGQVRDDAKFCGVCGHAFPQIPVTPQPEPDGAPIPQNGQPLKRKKSHAGLIIGVIAGILVLAGAITAAVLLLGNQKSTEPGVLFFRGDELWYADADGERLAADPGFDMEEISSYIGNLAISDDGRWIYYPRHGTSGWGETDTLVFRDTLDEDSKPRKLDRDVHVTSVSTNGDGSEVYYIRGEARTLCISDREEIREIDDYVDSYTVVGGRVYYTVQDGGSVLRYWEDGESHLIDRDESLQIFNAYNTGDLYYCKNESIDPWAVIEDDLDDSPEAEEMRDFLDEEDPMTARSLWWTDGKNTECLSERFLGYGGWSECLSYDSEVPVVLVTRMKIRKLSEMDSLEALENFVYGYYHLDRCELYLARGRELTFLSEDASMGSLSAEGSRAAWLENVDAEGYGRLCTQTLKGKPEILAENICAYRLGVQDDVSWKVDGNLFLNGESLGECDRFLTDVQGIDGFVYTREEDENEALCLWLDGEETVLEDHLEGKGICISEGNRSVAFRNSRGEIYVYDRGEPRLLAENTDVLICNVWSRSRAVPVGHAAID